LVVTHLRFWTNYIPAHLPVPRLPYYYLHGALAPPSTARLLRGRAETGIPAPRRCQDGHFFIARARAHLTTTHTRHRLAFSPGCCSHAGPAAPSHTCRMHTAHYHLRCLHYCAHALRKRACAWNRYGTAAYRTCAFAHADIPYLPTNVNMSRAYSPNLVVNIMIADGGLRPLPRAHDGHSRCCRARARLRTFRTATVLFSTTACVRARFYTTCYTHAPAHFMAHLAGHTPPYPHPHPTGCRIAGLCLVLLRSFLWMQFAPCLPLVLPGSFWITLVLLHFPPVGFWFWICSSLVLTLGSLPLVCMLPDGSAALPPPFCCAYALLVPLRHAYRLRVLLPAAWFTACLVGSPLPDSWFSSPQLPPHPATLPAGSPAHGSACPLPPPLQVYARHAGSFWFCLDYACLRTFGFLDSGLPPAACTPAVITRLPAWFWFSSLAGWFGSPTVLTTAVTVCRAALVLIRTYAAAVHLPLPAVLVHHRFTDYLD